MYGNNVPAPQNRAQQPQFPQAQFQQPTQMQYLNGQPIQQNQQIVTGPNGSFITNQMNTGLMRGPINPQSVQFPHARPTQVNQYGPGPSLAPGTNGFHPGQVLNRASPAQTPNMPNASPSAQFMRQPGPVLQAIHNPQNAHNIFASQASSSNTVVSAANNPCLPGISNEKQKRIQQLLVFLLHAAKCQLKEPGSCKFPYCSTMKEVHRHIKGCIIGKQCQYSHCISSRQILAHWKSCKIPNCSLCTPLKTHGKDVANGAATSNLGPQSSQMNQKMNSPQTTSAPAIQQNGNPVQSTSNQNGSVSNQSMSIPAPDVPRINKPWHVGIRVNLRGHVLGKLLNVMLPNPGSNPSQEQKAQEIISYARNIERQIFENANDEGHYLNLMSEKIYHVSKALEEQKLTKISVIENAPEEQTKRLKLSPQPEHNVATKNADLQNTEAKPTTDEAKTESTPEPKCEPAESPKSTKVDVKKETTPPPGEDKCHDADSLRMFILPLLEKLNAEYESYPFTEPVSRKNREYHKIIKEPMDLSTMREKLNSGQYQAAWDFCNDFWLMIDNAWLFNKKSTKIYKCASKFAEVFTSEMDPLMRTMGYCCCQKLSFTPLPLFCSGVAACTIARDQQYMMYEYTSTSFGVTVSDKVHYCLDCFADVPAEGVNMSEDPSDTTNIAKKEEFKHKTNNEINWEPFESCKHCHRKWHQICALHDKKVYPDGFTCEDCKTKLSVTKPENMFTAKRLPHNKLSTFLEERVNGYMKSKNKEDHEVIVRTLCVQDKIVDVKHQMRTKYTAEGFPERFPYRTKAVFVFEVIDGVEVCFFGLHVQEYGSECPEPNRRRVYIAYLDSVNFFQPRELRTDVYHEIVLGYLDYAKQLGYTIAHIWACPPTEGDDYIFPCHPTDQRIPKPKRLQEWYKHLLDKGIEERTVYDYQDIYKQAKDDVLVTPMQLPYFEGDFWPNIIEDCISQADLDDAKRKMEENSYDDVLDAGFLSSVASNKKKSSKSKKLTKKNSKMGKKKQESTGNTVTDKLYGHLEKHKEVFFIVRLMSPADAARTTQPIVDVDPLMPSDMMDGRDTFLTKSRDEHWEFSSLRRAKYTTMVLCHALHESGKEAFNCNNCSRQATLHCPVCPDFDLCSTCLKNTPHEHQMEPIKTSGGDASAKSRQAQIEKCLLALVHASGCRDANCCRWNCQKMKKILSHVKNCKKGNSNCAMCKQVIKLICHHAKSCQKDLCSVPYCMNIRKKLQEQKRSMARRSDMLMRRRMDGLSLTGPGHNIASNASGASVNTLSIANTSSGKEIDLQSGTTPKKLVTNDTVTPPQSEHHASVAGRTNSRTQQMYSNGSQSVGMHNTTRIAPPHIPTSVTPQNPFNHPRSQPSNMQPQQQTVAYGMPFPQMRAPSIPTHHQPHMAQQTQQRMMPPPNHAARNIVHNNMNATPHLMQALQQNKEARPPIAHAGFNQGPVIHPGKPMGQVPQQPQQHGPPSYNGAPPSQFRK